MSLAELIGESPGIAAVREQVARLLGRRADATRLPPVLLQGETGTGKGLLARALHRLSPRRNGPFVDVNCAAIPDTLLEAELFGVERGAFTGADRARPGLFQTAHRGTLFLDEIGLLPRALQSKLLKAIEERVVRRLGRTASEPVDVWILAATSEDLDEAIQTGRFGRDLYHRLAVVTLRLPPLRERGADVNCLADYFLARVCAEYGVSPKTLAEDARAALRAYPWPGNVRELANVMERAALLAEAPMVTATMLELPAGPPAERREPLEGEARDALRTVVGAAERERLLAVLEATDWNLSHAAARLHLPRNTLRYRMERHGLREPPPSRRPRDAATVPPPPSADVAATVPVGGEREHRRLTLLRVALVTARPAVSEFDPSRALDVVAEKLQSFGGQIEEVSPTAVVAAFGLEPVEDAPRRAALAALAIQKAAERARREEAAVSAVKLAIHVHDCVLRQAGREVAIEAESRQAADVVLAALLGAAPSGSVLVSAAAARLLERRFDLAPLLVAAGAPRQVYRLTGRERTGFGPGERVTAFVGRQEELELLRGRLASAVSGRGQVVAVIGEPGIGKSRLLFEFRRNLDAQQVSYLEGRCLSYAGAIPYLPVLDLLRQHCGITEADRPETVAEKVHTALGALGMPPAEHGPYLLHLLGVKEGTEPLRDVNPKRLKARLFEALRQVVARASRQRPRVLVVEDLHWIDEISDEWLGVLVETVAGAPILLIVSYRPGYQPAWLARSYVTQLALAPLSRDDSRAVLRSALPTAPLPAEILELLVTRADGNPFFLEELAKAVERRTEPRAAVAVPDTIQGVLGARIDRLAPADRRLLQAAAVIGKDVPVVLLQAIGKETEGVLRERLRQLQTADFLCETRLSPEPEYTFKHALTQEVAYGSLAPEPRRALHAEVARVLIGASPEMAERLPEGVARHLTEPEILAHHCTEAGLTEQAIGYWLRAGERATQRSANTAALAHLGKGFTLLETLPEGAKRDQTELALHLASAAPLFAAKGYAAPELERTFQRSLELCESVGERERIFPILYQRWVFHYATGRIAKMTELANEFLELAERQRNEGAAMIGHRLLGTSLWALGDPGSALTHLRRACAMYDPERHRPLALLYSHDVGVLSQCFTALSLWHLGHPEQALTEGATALERAHGLGHVNTVGSALAYAGILCLLCRAQRRVHEYAEAMLAHGAKHEAPYWAAVGRIFLGWSFVAQGRNEDGIAATRDGINACRALGVSYWLPAWLVLLAQAYGKAGALDDGLNSLREAEAIMERGGERWAEAELQRVKGELVLTRSRQDEGEADACFHRALDVARRQDAKSYELRAATSLARLWTGRGKGARARELLAPIYGWFTEGFDLPDLVEAKALLDELAGSYR